MLRATTSIRARRAAVVSGGGLVGLRLAGEAIRDSALARLDELLVVLEGAVTSAGGEVHWAAGAGEADEIVVRLVSATGAREVVKVKSLTTDEIGLNDALGSAGITPLETDLAELIVSSPRSSPRTCWCRLCTAADARSQSCCVRRSTGLTFPTTRPR